MDRIGQTISIVTTNNLVNVRQTKHYIWPMLNSAAPLLTRVVETSTDGLRSWDSNHSVTSSSRTVYAGGGTRYVTNVAGDGSLTVTHYLHGQLQSRTSLLGSIQTSRTMYYYDTHGRLESAIDSRNGTTTYGYDNADRVVSVATPLPGGGQDRQVTLTTLDPAGRITRIVHPDGTSLTNEYYLTGELQRRVGSRAYPVEYKYDAQGRMTNMTTWQGYPDVGAAVTTWKFDLQRGWLTNLLYEGDSVGISYTYTKAGRLRTRTWQRGITTTFETNAAGETVGMSYSSGASSVTYGLDRLGRRIHVIDSTGNRILNYSESGLLLSETYTNGPSSGLRITNGYDSFQRRTKLAFFTNDNSPVFTHTYGFDGASRLTNVSDGIVAASYSYIANSPLVDQIVYRSNSTVHLTTTKSYDYLNRLRRTVSGNSSDELGYAYTYNNANQRVQLHHSDGSFWLYNYEDLGQLTSGKRYWPDGVPVAGQQFEYSFDDIGNRISTAAGGDEDGFSMRSASYSGNLVNQYTGRDVPGAVDIVGLARAEATVTVNGQNAYRKGEYYWKELLTNNSSASVFVTVTNVAFLGGFGNTNMGSIYIAKSDEHFSFDEDGNETGNGRWTNRWDVENRLIEMESLPSVATGAKRKIGFTYDESGRRVSKVVSNWSGTAWTFSYLRRFIYDGLNVIAELDENTNTLRSYMWGKDLSGDLRGAGGAGGLLSVSDSIAGVHFAVNDGNGNIAALLGATGTGLSARYEYDPFGRLIRASGSSIATNNPFRFSSKYFDSESGLCYYGYRYYNPDTGRWLNRDPIAEMGFGKVLKEGFHQSRNFGTLDGLRLNKKRLPSLCGNDRASTSLDDAIFGTEAPYLFVNNSPPNHTDVNGLDCPGCDGLGDLVKAVGLKLGNDWELGDCALACCAKHDDCYDTSKCTAGSWHHTFSLLHCAYHASRTRNFIAIAAAATAIAWLANDCDRCNIQVVSCLSGCVIHPDKADGGLYYCAKERRYITIGPAPADYLDIDAAKRACCNTQ